jgi:hypothetical protein
MISAIVDHLWQSIGFWGLASALAIMLRRHSAATRTWVWRVAALKFLVPFSLLFALGAWCGFPVRHNAIPPPAVLSEAAATGLTLATPAQSFNAPPFVLALALLTGLFIAAACLLRTRRQLQRAREESLAEESRTALSEENRPPALGFFKTATLMTAAALAMFLPFTAGALADRLQRQAALIIDTRSLSAADISIKESAPGFGSIRVTASSDLVEIRHINLKDLVSLTYGIDQFEVFGGAMPWLYEPYYDVRVAGRVHRPPLFDPYSLREPMTKFLYDEFGVSIRVNGACQEPCKDYQSFVVERVKWCKNPLGPHACQP